jgi:serine/threonine-protein kinase SRPK3
MLDYGRTQHRCQYASTLSSSQGALVKIIIAEVVEALVQLHSLSIIHTGLPELFLQSILHCNVFCIDLKLDNVLFNIACDDESIGAWLSKSGPSTIDGEFEFEGQLLPIVRSQPIPHGFRWDQSPSVTELLNVTLIDFGHGELFLHAS